MITKDNSITYIYNTIDKLLIEERRKRNQLINSANKRIKRKETRKHGKL